MDVHGDEVELKSELDLEGKRVSELSSTSRSEYNAISPDNCDKTLVTSSTR